MFRKLVATSKAPRAWFWACWGDLANLGQTLTKYGRGCPTGTGWHPECGTPLKALWYPLKTWTRNVFVTVFGLNRITLTLLPYMLWSYTLSSLVSVSTSASYITFWPVFPISPHTVHLHWGCWYFLNLWTFGVKNYLKWKNENKQLKVYVRARVCVCVCVCASVFVCIYVCVLWFSLTEAKS